MSSYPYDVPRYDLQRSNDDVHIGKFPSGSSRSICGLSAIALSTFKEKEFTAMDTEQTKKAIDYMESLGYLCENCKDAFYKK